ncbi:hypothetical protein JCGZ_18436 [Jatropha curcas]|uniref:Uncharacterized protein n=1 Tax=Jatropha curcas TaxID=180498 RepID=A0A067K0W3_JATCU|nr:hypothetical protein JCGZ_18436 [Jatropha curcas]
MDQDEYSFLDLLNDTYRLFRLNTDFIEFVCRASIKVEKDDDILLMFEKFKENIVVPTRVIARNAALAVAHPVNLGPDHADVDSSNRGSKGDSKGDREREKEREKGNEGSNLLPQSDIVDTSNRQTELRIESGTNQANKGNQQRTGGDTAIEPSQAHSTTTISPYAGTYAPANTCCK